MRTYIRFDVQGLSGTINLALTTSSSTAISLASRESGANAPQLVVETMH